MQTALIIEAALVILSLAPAQTTRACLTTIQEAQMSKTGCGQEL